MTDVKKIEKLVAEELKAMCIKHKQEKFNSPHEAYAVTLEEYEEAKSDLDFVQFNLTDVWLNVKMDRSAKKDYGYVRALALHAIQELIQVCACCDKAVRE